MNRFPNLFVVGAMKAGTSSLHEYLHQHPEIFMSRFKEPQYFAPHRVQYGLWGQGNPLPEPGVDWYLRLFADAKDVKYAGESSVSYSARHWVSSCEERIWEFNPDARIIYLMRDPVERAISHYWQFVRAGREDLAPAVAVRRRDDYVARSDYAFQIEPYLRRFGQDRVYLLTLEELENDSAGTLRQMFGWLGVEERITIDTSERLNVTQPRMQQARRFQRPLARFLRGWRWTLWQQKAPRWFSGMLDCVAYRDVERSKVDLTEAIEHLRSRLLPRIEALTRLTGREYPSWKTLYGAADSKSVTAVESPNPRDVETDCRYQAQVDCLW